MGQFPNTKRGADGKFAKANGDEGRAPLDVTLPSSTSPTDEIGVGGTAIFGGYIQEHETDSTLRGIEKYKTYSNCVANVAIIAAAVRSFLNFVADATWKVEAPEDSGEQGEQLAQQVQDMMHDMDTPWHRSIRRLAMFKFYGFSILEWIAKRNDDGSIGMRDLRARPQITIERWITDKHGRVLGVIQTNPQTGEDIPIPRQKLVYVVDDALSDSPEGLGLLRHLVDSCERLRRFQQLEGFGYEGDLRGIPIGRAPLAELDNMVKAKKITKAKAQELLNGLQAFIKNHIKNPSLGIMLDSTPYKQTGENRTPSNTPQWDLSLLDGGTYSLAEVAEAISRIQREIARILHVEHMMLGENSAGTRSLSSDKVAAFAQLVDSALTEIVAQMESDWLKPLWELNGWPEELMPSLKVEQASSRDPAEIAEVMRAIASAGVQVDRQDEAIGELFDLMGMTRLAPLAEIDPDLVLSAEDSQAMAMEIAGARQQGASDDEGDDDGDGPPPRGRPNVDETPGDDEDGED